MEKINLPKRLKATQFFLDLLANEGKVKVWVPTGCLERPDSFFYKTLLLSTVGLGVIATSAGGTQFIKKSRFNALIKNVAYTEIPISRLLYNWSHHKLDSGRKLEKMIAEAVYAEFL